MLSNASGILAIADLLEVIGGIDNYPIVSRLRELAARISEMETIADALQRRLNAVFYKERDL